MTTTHEILFFGEVLPGHDPASTRAALQGLLKCPADTLERVFSGERVTLRKGLATWQAEHYLSTLTGIGLKVVVEPPLPETAAAPPEQPAGGADLPRSAAPLLAEPEPQPAPVQAQAATMTCPACGEQQPPRTLCRACSIDMPRYAAAAKAMASERNESAATPRQTALAEDEATGDTPLFGFGLDGRFGRSAYLQSAFLGFAAAVLLMPAMLFLGLPGILLGLLLVLMLMVWGVRASVLRCHDLGFNGWWSLATLVPVIGFIAALALLLVPGQKEHNAWGPRRRPVGIPALVGALLVAVAGAGVMARFTPDSLPDPRQLAGLETPRHDDEAAFLARYDARQDRIVMYSLTTCGYCTEKRRQFERMGVRVTEYMIDEDSAAEDRLNDRLQRAGITGAIGTPILEVNGQILPNNPSLSILAHHLYGRSDTSARAL
ncbi:MAG: DUF805 domain-containing protein [Zoogloea sp.]|nr:DUF805 domain-containing protein [Zoogloea sp.]MCA0184509.1 DUF805 domain-containing protein [Pseudomonadota bacterium]